MASGDPTVLKAQKVLNVLGYGPVDETGTPSEAFKQKLVAFQQARGIEPNGEVDDATKAAMDTAMKQVLVQQSAQPQSTRSAAAAASAALAPAGPPATVAPAAPATGLAALFQRPMLLGGIAIVGLIAYVMYRDSQKSLGEVEERRNAFKRAAWREVEADEGREERHERLTAPARKKCGKTPDFEDGEPVEEAP